MIKGHVIRPGWNIFSKHLDDNSCDVHKQATCDIDAINRRIGSHIIATYTTEFDEDCFKACTFFKSYHYYPLPPFRMVLSMAELFMLWLKHCVVRTPSCEAITIETIYLGIFLAQG